MYCNTFDANCHSLIIDTQIGKYIHTKAHTATQMGASSVAHVDIYIYRHKYVHTYIFRYSYMHGLMPACTLAHTSTEADARTYIYVCYTRLYANTYEERLWSENRYRECYFMVAHGYICL